MRRGGSRGGVARRTSLTRAALFAAFAPLLYLPHLALQALLFEVGGFAQSLFLKLLQVAAHLLRALALGFRLTDFADGVFNAGVGTFEERLRLLAGFGQHRLAARAGVGDFLVVTLEQSVEVLFLVVHGAALVFPIVLVANDVLDIFLAHHVIAPHELFSLTDEVGRQPDFAGNLEGKGAARRAEGEGKEGLQLLAVVEHRACHYTRCMRGVLLEILIVRGDDAEGAALYEAVEDALSKYAADLRFRAAAHLVDEQERGGVGLAEHQLHVLQMRGIGR